MFIKTSVTFLLSIGAILAASSSGQALSCNSPGINLQDHFDRDLLYSLSGIGDWKTLNSFDQLRVARTTNVSFVYIIKEAPENARAGVVVVKAGLLNPSETKDSRARKTIQLVRNEAAARFTNICHGKNQSFLLGGRAVSAKSYDDFHDFTGRNVDQELAILQAFHISYEGPRGSCRATGDGTDGDRIPSNRSQLSYSPTVVKGGQHTGLAGLNPFASAASDYLDSQRTEIRRYKTSSDGSSCISFRIPIYSANNFIRINDLDARQGPFDLRWPEREWR